jgi:hypothetical protein
MPLVTCPSCQKSGNVPEKNLGQRIVCPACKATFTAIAQVAAPGPSSPAAAVTADTPAADQPMSPEEKEDQAIDQVLRKKQAKQTARSVEVIITEDQTDWFNKGLRFGCGFLVAQFLFAIVFGSLWILLGGLILGSRH